MTRNATTVTSGDRPALRPLIMRSWHRSSACGLRPSVHTELPYSNDFDGDSLLVRAATPVLERLITSLSETRHSMLLADRQGRLVQRKVGTKSLGNSLDRASIAPGFAFSEEFAGTNGVGTALEEARVVSVRGEEHFAETLRQFTCVGVPIHNPARGTVEGVLDFTCLANDYNELIEPLLVESVKHIETRLSHQTSPAEAALLEGFLRTCRSTRAAVVAFRPNMFLTNAAAAPLLSPSDQALLWDVGLTLRSRGRAATSVELAGGRFTVEFTSVGDDECSGGLVLRLTPARTTASIDAARPSPPDRLPRTETSLSTPSPLALPGRSAQWKCVRARLAELGELEQPVAVTGEPGTGKMLVAKHLAELGALRGGLGVFDAEREETATEATELVDRCRATLSNGGTALIRRIDCLPARAVAGLTDLVRQGDRLIVTSLDEPSDDVQRALSAFPHQLWLPPLRQRAEDITDIIPALLVELAPHRRPTCALPALQALMRYPWPGNATELRETLAVALSTAPGNQIEMSHLPARVLKRAHRRHFTPMERAERDLIIEILSSVDNNRTEAAKIIGIGRATLYRKLRKLGIAVGDELTE